MKLPLIKRVFVFLLLLATISVLRAQGDPNQNPPAEATLEITASTATLEASSTAPDVSPTPPSDIIATDVVTPAATEAAPIDTPVTETDTPIETETSAPPATAVSTVSPVDTTLPPEPTLVLVKTEDFDNRDVSEWDYGPGLAYEPRAEGTALQIFNNNTPVRLRGISLADAAVLIYAQNTNGPVRLSVREGAAGGYSVVFSADGTLMLYGDTRLLQSISLLPTLPDEWRALRLSAVGDVVRVQVDGVEVIALRDTQPLPAGTVSFGAAFTLNANALLPQNNVRFDNFALYSTQAVPELTAEPSPVAPTATSELITTPTEEPDTTEAANTILAAVEAPTCTYTVADGDTAGFITALQSSNADPNLDMVCLAPNGAYEITVSVATDQGWESALPLVTGETIVEGRGATLQQTNTSRFVVFNVGSTGSLTLRDLTFNESVFPAYVIHQLTLERVTVQSSGTLFTELASTHLIITDSTFVNGNGDVAISNHGVLDITNTLFESVSGQALANAGGTVTIRGSTFLRNYTNYGGGAISNSGPLTITDSIFDGNHAGVATYSNGNHGGAIYHSAGQATITNTIIRNNEARGPNAQGGAVYVTAFGSMTITNSCFYNNSTPPSTNDYKDFQSSNGQLTLTNNWWGTIHGPNTPRSDTAASNFMPFLTVAPEGCDAAPLQIVERSYGVLSNTATAFTLTGDEGVAPYTFGITTQPSNGIVTGSAPTMTYTPNTDFQGIDTITVNVTDASGQTASGQIRFYVNVSVPPNIIVTTTTQEVPSITNGNCTLGEAIKAANSNLSVDGCPAGYADAPDVIGLQSAATYPLTIIDNITSEGETALPAITSAIVIEGNGATLTRIGGAQMRSLYVAANGNLTVNQLTVTNGALSIRGGGAILSLGTLVVNNSTFTGNRSSEGGAIAAFGSSDRVTINNSVFINNVSVGQGGAVFVNSPYTLTIRASHFENNRANGATSGYGGAVNSPTDVVIEGSTFITNQAIQGPP